MVTTPDLNLPVEIEESEFKVRVSNCDVDDDDDCNGDGGGGGGGGECRGSEELDYVSVSAKASSDDENGRSGDIGMVVRDLTLNNDGDDDDDVKVSSSSYVMELSDGGDDGDDDFEVKVARNDSVDERMESVDNDDDDDRNDSTVEQMDAKVEPLDASEHLESDSDGSDETPRGSADEFEASRDPFSFEDEPGDRAGSSGSSAVSQYDSRKFTDGGSNQEVSLSDSMRLTLDPGEMVWGKVKSHPWWPGQIFSETLASSTVRRLKREGHVLVAFFGDSSYGWFDPSELVPFDYKFEEKSRQTGMKNFVKAVEEALDEASRRYALGLACKCRNTNNFSPGDVEGDFVVDVGDYPGGIYSDILIEKARASFQPAETLSFITKLAMSPRNNDTRSLDMIENTSKVFAYRKAVFEEFDETYSQAFGYPAEHSLPKDLTNVTMKNTPKAPLSGRLVIAEALSGGRKSPVKSKKVKDRSNKDKYLFKRRDVPNNAGSVHNSEGRTNSYSPTGYLDGLDSPDFPIPQVIVNCEKGDSAVNQNVARKPSVAINASLDSNSSHEKENDGQQKNYGSFLQQRDDEGERLTPPYQEGIQQPELNREDTALDDSNSHCVMTTGAKVKKTKYLKGPIGEMGSDNSIQGEKKRKKEHGPETASVKKQKRLAGGKFAGKSISIDGVDSHQSQKGDGTTKSVPDSTVDAQSGLEMPQLLHALRGLALDPFYGVERNWHTSVPPIFLRFRSLVFQKGASGQVGSSQIISDQPSKLPRPAGVRSDDPTKGILKRPPSDRQEEKTAKKLKKMKDLKSLAADNKASLKNPEATRPEGKGSMAGAAAAHPPPKSGRSSSVKKAIPSSRVPDPTMLVMKFPATANLPSGNELRARFGRFGPLDHDGTRVFWKSFTCRVVFRYKSDAENAYKFAVGNNTLFGSGQVRYYLKDTTSDDPPGEAPATTAPAFNPLPPPQQPPVQLKSCLKKDTGDEPAANNNNNVGGRVASRVKFMLGTAEGVSVNNRKFNNNGDDGASTAYSSTTTTIGMDFTSNIFQKVIPSSLPSVLPLPSHFATQNTHFTELLPPPPPPVAPPRLTATITTTTTATATTITLPPLPPYPRPIDISQPMLNLLTRCKDLVSNVSSLLGYVPYHPL